MFKAYSQFFLSLSLFQKVELENYFMFFICCILVGSQPSVVFNILTLPHQATFQ